MKTCIQRKLEASLVLDNNQASTGQVNDAKEVLKKKMCFSCSNPLVYKLELDDLLCQKKIA